MADRSMRMDGGHDGAREPKAFLHPGRLAWSRLSNGRKDAVGDSPSRTRLKSGVIECALG